MYDHKLNGIMVWNKDHPRSSHGRIRECILIAEKTLGKFLPKTAVVHHPNGVHDNSSLVVCENQGYHLFLHRRQDAYKACEHATWRKCQYCKQWDNPENITGIIHKYHRECINTYHRNLRRIKNDDKNLL